MSFLSRFLRLLWRDSSLLVSPPSTLVLFHHHRLVAIASSLSPLRRYPPRLDFLVMLLWWRVSCCVPQNAIVSAVCVSVCDRCEWKVGRRSALDRDIGSSWPLSLKEGA
ncbi:hypothetical protein QCA50_013576 [Cerrena zonata]|uniref:Secreted protein n=1 Tax=Cerrena zonata TaxID=2478898 RepID=A0AAW0FW54_9APHY